jgi:glucose-6-phosphate isomerase
MESIGKQLDRNGNEVFQGITVFGNKGSTDQHSYIQQLKDGLSDSFVTFIEVLEDGKCSGVEVEPGTTSGDFLQGFLLGTRTALAESRRQSISITMVSTTPFMIGGIISLFERAVGLYASMVNINAYHQPGVESGKVAAGRILRLRQSLLLFMRANSDVAFDTYSLASSISYEGDVEEVFKLCERLAANPNSKIWRLGSGSTARYSYKA